jgi:hypothetical protein
MYFWEGLKFSNGIFHHFQEYKKARARYTFTLKFLLTKVRIKMTKPKMQLVSETTREQLVEKVEGVVIQDADGKSVLGSKTHTLTTTVKYAPKEHPARLAAFVRARAELENRYNAPRSRCDPPKPEPSPKPSCSKTTDRLVIKSAKKRKSKFQDVASEPIKKKEPNYLARPATEAEKKHRLELMTGDQLMKIRDEVLAKLNDIDALLIYKSIN